MGNGRVKRKIFENKQEGKRKMGRPRKRWLEEVEKIYRRLSFKDGDKRQWTEKNGLFPTKIVYAFLFSSRRVI
jgi:LPS sulfotransferase NodH